MPTPGGQNSPRAMNSIPPEKMLRIFKVGPLFSNELKKGGRYSAARSRKEGWEIR